jgi:hypothetical protein
MSEEKHDKQPDDVLETREVWTLMVRPEEAYPWVEWGTPSADAAAILRTYDYRRKNVPDEAIVIARANVTVTVEDPERLREIAEKKAVDEGDAVVQSE